jgi:RNA polymerase sigma-70 factor (ECF subfamily)
VHESDEELMQRVARDDRTAFGELFDRHHAALYAFLCRFLGDAAAAEDVTQDAFWRVWQYRRSFDRKRAFRAWLYAIARNAAIREAQRGGQGPAAHLELTDTRHETGASAAAPRPLDEGVVERLTVREQVRAALQSLPEDQRLCLLLREYDQMSYAEIARVLGCSSGNARVLAYRARGAMRDLLRPILEEEGTVV